MGVFANVVGDHGEEEVTTTDNNHLNVNASVRWMGTSTREAPKKEHKLHIVIMVCRYT